MNRGAVVGHRLQLMPLSESWLLATTLQPPPYWLQKRQKTCGAKRDRTADLLNAIQALSQLSYSPKIATPS